MEAALRHRPAQQAKAVSPACVRGMRIHRPELQSLTCWSPASHDVTSSCNLAQLASLRRPASFWVASRLVSEGSRPLTRWCATLLGICLQESKLAVIVATVTDDVRLFEVPKLRVCALRFTETARARIVKVRVLGCLALRTRLSPCPAGSNKQQ